MLQHELAHLERRDHYFNCLQIWFRVVFFFHPLVRYACRQLHLERELACDGRVLSMGTTAEGIVNLSEDPTKWPPFVALRRAQTPT